MLAKPCEAFSCAAEHHQPHQLPEIRTAVGGTTASSAGFDSASNPRQLPFCSTEKLLSEDAKLPVKHSLDDPGFIPAP